MNTEYLEERELFFRGESHRAYEFLGVHPSEHGGFVFRVWAPRAKSVHLVGDFNFWNTEELNMQRSEKGVWEIVSRHAKIGDRYQYYIEGCGGNFVYKNDPYALRFAPLPDVCSLVWLREDYPWGDGAYRKRKNRENALCRPVNIYEVHLGSWRRRGDGSVPTVLETARELIPYVKKMGYTHVEFLPITEFPYEGSWGYQVTGYFAPSHRYGTPLEFKEAIDLFHRSGIGVILDWVPAHFPKDEYGLYEFDGSFCYESADPKMNEHREWGTRIFDYSRFEVASFLMSSALFWIREYHVDGLRVDAVASMLYLDYCRTDFTPNREGGNVRLEAVEFFRKLNRAAFAELPSVLMIAEESTAFPKVTAPGEYGGLGFLLKWNMGWMNDILRFMKLDPLFRKGSHNQMTFSLSYAFAENYILPLSHDEVVHLKKSVLGKMPGSYDDRFANARLLYGFMMAHPGKKLNFMGNEFGQFTEWDEKKELDWMVLDFEKHRMLQTYLSELNSFYRGCRALWDRENSASCFSWISADDRDNGVIAFRRIAENGDELIAVLNFCPVLRKNYRIGLPRNGIYRAVFSSDRRRFGGTGERLPSVLAEEIPLHGLSFSGSFTVPPLSATYYKLVLKKQKEASL